MNSKALLRGKLLISPYNNELEDIRFCSIVEKGLKDLNINKPYAIQRYSWPHVFRGRNCFIVGGPANMNGKTLGYLVPVIAKIINGRRRMYQEAQVCGPCVIILCSSIASASKIEYQVKKLADNDLIVYKGWKSDHFIRQSLERNPDILICKPDFILYIMEKFSQFFSFKRLEYFVVDDCQHLFEELIGQTEEILTRLSYEIERTGSRSLPLQFVFCGNLWVETLVDAYEKVQAPVLIISSPVQALLYGGVKVRVDLLQDDYEKLDKLSDIIMTSEIHKHFIVVCKSRKSAAMIGTKLFRSRQINCKINTDDDESSDEFMQIAKAWRARDERDKLVFVLTDEDLTKLELTDVAAVINFDIPMNGPDGFGLRHSYMWTLFRDISSNERSSPVSRMELTSYVFVTPDENRLHKIVHFLKSLNASIPAELEEISNKIQYEDMKRLDMCSYVERFGRCNALNKRECQLNNRHFFALEHFQERSIIPAFQSVRVELTIVQAIELNCYMGRLEAVYEVKSGRKHNVIDVVQELAKRHEKLNEAMERERRILDSPSSNSLCTVRMAEHYYTGFTRARIIKECSTQWEIWCVDIGEYTLRPPDQIFVLSEEFVDLPSFVVKVIIAGLQPVGDNEMFRKNITGIRGNAKDELKNRTVTGKVALGVGNTIWVKSLFQFQRNSDGELIQDLNVRHDFISQRCLAEDNPGHLEALYKLCEEIGLNCDAYKSLESLSPEFHTSKDSYDWAFLRTSPPEMPIMISAQSTYTVSPDKIYFVQNKFADILLDLMSDINEEINKLIETKYKDYPTSFCTVYEEGLCIAAKDSEDYWNRGIIVEVNESDNIGAHTYDVLFVDYGDTRKCLSAKDLFPIPKKFISRLPFQVIAARLNHIEPMKNDISGQYSQREWSFEAKRHVKEALIKDGFAENVDVVPILKLTDKDHIPCSYYEAYIFCGNELGEGLVEKQYARKRSGTWDNFQAAKKILLKQLNNTFPDLQDEDDDDVEDFYDGQDLAEDPGDYDICIGDEFVNHVLKGLGIDFEQNSITQHFPSTAENNDHNVEVPTESAVTSRNPSKAVIMSGDSNNTSCASSAAPETETKKHPTVQWSQTSNTLTLKICVPDITEYDFTIAPDKYTISFLSIQPPDYEFSLKTWAKIKGMAGATLLGQFLIINLEKLSVYKWPQVCDDKYPWIKRDMDNICSGSEESDVDTDYKVPEPEKTNYRSIVGDVSVQPDGYDESESSSSDLDVSDIED